jgi:hypothetical protein
MVKIVAAGGREGGLLRRKTDSPLRAVALSEPETWRISAFDFHQSLLAYHLSLGGGDV